MKISLSAFAPEDLVARDGFGSPVPRQPAHLHTQAESGAYLRDSPRVPRWRPFIYLKSLFSTEYKKKSSSCSADAPVPYVENATLSDPRMCGDPVINGSHAPLNDAEEAYVCDYKHAPLFPPAQNILLLKPSHTTPKLRCFFIAMETP